MSASETQTAQPRSRIRRLLASRKAWAVVLVVGGYLLFLQILSALIDERALRREIRNQLEYIVGADVLIDQVETEIRPFGGWRIRLRDIHVENASPDYNVVGPAFTCRKMVFEGDLLDLLAGRWHPRILVKDWVLQVVLSEESGSNLGLLFQPQGTAPAAWGQWPFSEIVRARQTFELENGYVRIAERESGAILYRSGLLQGGGSYTPGASAVGLSGALDLEVRGPTHFRTPQPQARAALGIQDFEAGPETLTGSWTLRLAAEEPPGPLGARLLNLPPGLVEKRPERARLALYGSFADRHLTAIQELEVTLAETALPLFSLRAPVRLLYRRAAGPPAAAEADRRAPFDITVEEKRETGARRSRLDGRWRDGALSVTLVTDILDPGRAPAIAPGSPWSAVLPAGPLRLQAEAAECRLLGFRVVESRLAAELRADRIERLALQGRFYDGRVDFCTGGWRVADPDWPRAMGATIRGADAAELLPAMAHLLPPAAHLSPAAGRLSCLLFHVPPTTDPALVLDESLLQQLDLKLVGPEAVQAGEGWHVTLIVSDPLRFDEPGGNPILEALWPLPGRLRAALRLPAPEGGGAEILSALRLHTGMLKLSRGTEAEPATTLQGEVVSRELGRLTLEGHPTADGFRLRLRLHPFAALRRSAEDGLPFLRELSAETLRRLVRWEEAEGLRVEVPLAPEAAPVYTLPPAALLAPPDEDPIDPAETEPQP